MALLLKYARSILPAFETEAFASLGGVCALGLGGFCGSRKHVRVTHDASTFWRYHVVCLQAVPTRGRRNRSGNSLYSCQYAIAISR